MSAAVRKYAVIARTGLLTQLQYTGNLLGRAGMYAVLVFMFTRLWAYIYQGTEDVIAGYTFNQMLWYLIMSELTWFSARPQSVRFGIAGDIRSGRIAYTLNKPYSYAGYTLARYAGEASVNYGINVIIALLIGLTMVGPLHTFSLWSFPLLAVTFALSALTSALVYLLIALVSFWVEENAPFIWIYEKFMLLGIIFPMEVFPGWARTLLSLSPVYPCVYAPAKMTVDFSLTLWLAVTRTQLIYIAAMILLIHIIFKRGERRLNVNGG